MSGSNIPFPEVLTKMCNLSECCTVNEKPENAVSFMCGTIELYIPLTVNINPEEEKQRILTELKYFEGFLNSVMAKLNNEKFVNSAPEAVVNNERKKQADTQAKIDTLKGQLETISYMR